MQIKCLEQYFTCEKCLSCFYMLLFITATTIIILLSKTIHQGWECNSMESTFLAYTKFWAKSPAPVKVPEMITEQMALFNVYVVTYFNEFTSNTQIVITTKSCYHYCGSLAATLKCPPQLHLQDQGHCSIQPKILDCPSH